MTVGSIVHKLTLHTNRTVELTVDGQPVSVPEGATIMDACDKVGIETPTLCYGETLTPVNACRVCVVELEGSRTLVPACARNAEHGMVVRTGTERVRHSRKLVMELLASSVDLSYAPIACAAMSVSTTPTRTRFGPPAPANGHDRDDAHTGHHHSTEVGYAATVQQPPKIDNDLYVRDYSQLHPLLQVRPGLWHRPPEYLCHRRRRARFRCSHRDRVHRSAAGFRLCLLRQLHRRLPDRCV